MSWIRDIDGGLVNLEHVRELNIGEMEAGEGVEAPAESHAVVARFPQGEQTVLFAGDEAECQARLDHLATKLPMARLA